MGYGKSTKERMGEEKVGGGEFWSPPEGDTRIRIMPPAGEDQEEFWFRTGTHFRVGPDERAVPCPLTAGVRDTCFLCRMVKQLKRGDEDDQAEADEMSASPRYLLNIIDLDNPETGVQVWRCPVTVFRRIHKYRMNEDDYGDMTDLENGYDMIVTRTGGGLKTEYDIVAARNNTRFPPDKLLKSASKIVAEMYQAIADEGFELPDLSTVDTFLGDDEMKRIYEGLPVSRSEAAEDESEEEEEPESGTRRRTVRDDEEESEEESPKRSSRRSSKSDEEEPSDEGADEEKSTRRSSRRRSSGAEESSSGGRAGRSRIRGRVRNLD